MEHVQPYLRPHPEVMPLLRASPDWLASRSELLIFEIPRSFQPQPFTHFLADHSRPFQVAQTLVSHSAINGPQGVDGGIAFAQLFEAESKIAFLQAGRDCAVNRIMDL
jgi:hypothetical protein